MKIYFLSSLPCELTLNGVFFGITDRFERFANVELSDKIFAKFTPQNGLPVGLFLDEALLTDPPVFCEVYIVKEGVALYVKDFPPLDHTLVPIAQARFENDLVTLFRQGAVHVSIQTKNDFFISPLPPSFANGKISKQGEFFFIEGEDRLAVYDRKGKRLLLEEILSFDVQGNVLNATLPLSDSLARVADCAWELRDHALTQTKFTIRQTAERANASPLAYAFFESMLIGAEYERFLSDDLKGQAKRIKELLSPFLAVTLTSDPNTCGLVKVKSERVFELLYASITVENGQITDIKW